MPKNMNERTPLMLIGQGSVSVPAKYDPMLFNEGESQSVPDMIDLEVGFFNRSRPASRSTSSTSSIKDDLDDLDDVEDLEEEIRYEEKHGSGPAAKKPKGKGLKGGRTHSSDYIMPIVYVIVGLWFAGVLILGGYLLRKNMRSGRSSSSVHPATKSPNYTVTGGLEEVDDENTPLLPTKPSVSESDLKLEGDVATLNQVLSGHSETEPVFGAREDDSADPPVEPVFGELSVDDENTPLLPTKPSNHEEVYDAVSGTNYVNHRRDSVKVPSRRHKKLPFPHIYERYPNAYTIVLGAIIGLLAIGAMFGLSIVTLQPKWVFK